MIVKTFFQKLKSRKFLAMIAGVVTGLAMVFGLDENIITTVAGAVTTLGSIIAYISTEGKIDAAAVAAAVKAARDVENALIESKET